MSDDENPNVCPCGCHTTPGVLHFVDCCGPGGTHPDRTRPATRTEALLAQRNAALAERVRRAEAYLDELENRTSLIRGEAEPLEDYFKRVVKHRHTARAAWLAAKGTPAAGAERHAPGA